MPLVQAQVGCRRAGAPCYGCGRTVAGSVLDGVLAGGCGVHIIEQEAKVIKEYDHDEELKHLGYSASLLGGLDCSCGGHAQDCAPSGERLPAQAQPALLWREHRD